MIRNFLFHRVNPKRDQLWDPMDVALFEKCISYISKNFEVVILEDLVESPKLMSKKNMATILFDDGYKDNILYAAPILDKYNCKASFYVVTDCIELNIPTWTYILEYTFKETKRSDLDLDFVFLPEELKVKNLPDQKARMEYVKKLKPVLKTVRHEDRNKVIETVREAYGDVDLPKIMMDWQDLLALRKAGHYIGSHTLSHSMLGTMTDTNEIKEELELSARAIEKNLGYFPKTISYPAGSYNQASIALSKEIGYSMGLAVKQKSYYPNENDIFEIPRIELYNESWIKTWMRITTLLETLKENIGYYKK